MRRHKPRPRNPALERHRSHRVGRWLAPLAVVVVTCVAFFPALQNDFVHWDDNVNLVENPHYRGLGWQQLRWMFTTTLLGHWIPLTWMTFGLDYLLWGMNPFGYHLTSLLLHAANAALFCLLALRLLRLATAGFDEPTLRLGAAAAALFFALHPLRVESVAWVTERRDVLSSLFFLLTLLTYLAAARIEGPHRRRWLAGSIALYALAILSKAIVMTLPVVLLVLDFYPLRRLGARWRDWATPAARWVWAEKLPYLLLAGAGAGMALYAQSGLLSPLEKYSLGARLAMAAYSLAFYLWKSLLPVSLSPLYERPAQPSLLDPPFLPSAVTVALITGALLLVRRRGPGGLAAWLFYAVTLAPVSGLIQTGLQLTADRYSYLPCLGWGLVFGAVACVVLRAGAHETPGAPWARAASGGAALWLIGLGALTWQQAQVWHDSERLWAHAVSVDPSSAVAHNNLGTTLLAKRNFAEAASHFRHAIRIDPTVAAFHVNLGRALVAQDNLGEATASYEEALRLDSSAGEAHAELGVALAGQGRVPEAIEHLRQALNLKPDLADAHNELGILLAQQGRLSEAVEHYRRALQLQPGFADGYNNLGLALARQGKLGEAIEHYRRALTLRPAFAQAHLSLGNALLGQGQANEALKHYQEAVRLNPSFAEAHTGLGVTLFSQGKVEQAIEHFRQAIQLKPGFAEAHNNLGFALARQGKLSEAIQHYRQALQINPSFSQARSNLDAALAGIGR